MAGFANSLLDKNRTGRGVRFSRAALGATGVYESAPRGKARIARALVLRLCLLISLIEETPRA